MAFDRWLARAQLPPPDGPTSTTSPSEDEPGPNTEKSKGQEQAKTENATWGGPGASPSAVLVNFTAQLPPPEPISGGVQPGVPYAVSWNQSQLLTVHLVDGATAAYNIPTAVWLAGPLGVGALRRALAGAAAAPDLRALSPHAVRKLCAALEEMSKIGDHRMIRPPTSRADNLPKSNASPTE